MILDGLVLQGVPVMASACGPLYLLREIVVRHRHSFNAG